MKRTLLILLAAASLAGCETGVAPALGPVISSGGNAAFSDHDFAWSQGSGGGSIDGSLNYQGGPAAFTCSDVVLAPMTPWFRARMRVLYLSDSQAVVPVNDVRSRTPPESSGNYTQYARHAQCDGSNHFSFTGLPDGTWFLITVATPVGGGDKVAVMRRVDVRGGNRHVNLP
jgi:hypothetical protein